MRTNYVLVDYESVQPESVAELAAAGKTMKLHRGAEEFHGRQPAGGASPDWPTL